MSAEIYQGRGEGRGARDNFLETKFHTENILIIYIIVNQKSPEHILKSIKSLFTVRPMKS